MKKQVSKKTKELKEANKKLQEYHDHLEDEVKKRTEELERSNEELERFAHTVSHDLRAPLRAMSGFSSALLEDYEGQVDKEGREMMERIKASSNRMDGLITDLLEYSRLTRKDVDIECFDLEEIIDQVQEDLKELIREEDAEIIIDRPLSTVEANEAILRQVLENLIKNGIKFVEEDTTPVIKISTKEKNGMVRIEVEDNGIGIPEGQGEKVFQMFERLHGREKYRGTGAGLAMVKRGVEKMEGEVGFESELDEGSTFWIELPKEGSGS